MIHISERLLDEANRHLDQTLYFNPQKRWRLERAALKIKAFAEEKLPKLGNYSPEEQDLILNAARTAEYVLERITAAKVEVASRKLTKCRFVMYKHPFSSMIVIMFHFYKPAEKCFKDNATVYPHGLPHTSKRRVKAYFYKHRLDVSGYQEVERGQFRVKYLSFNQGFNTLWNRHYKLRYLLEGNPKEPGTQYCRLMDG